MHSTTPPHVVIIGAGIIGLAHAITAREAGWRVTVLERDPRALGASIRNFGTVWPIGCAPGAARAEAMFGVQRWKELSAVAGFWIANDGSLSLAHRDEAWSVLQEFAELETAPDDCALLSATEVIRRFPAVAANGLRGALWSRAECVVHPPSALAALARHAERLGVQLCFETLVARVDDSTVRSSDGRLFPFDRLLIAAGEEMRLLFPRELASAEIQRCRLQMLRTAAQPPGFNLGAILVSDLTLCHYPAFQQCPSTAALGARLDAELPQHRAEGVHVIVAQHHDGSVTVGDSHEYGDDLPPESRSEVDDLILSNMASFVHLPEPRIASRWQGVYLKSRIGQTQVVLQPRERVTMVTAMGGLGMTLSWGLARRTIAEWMA